MKPHFSDPEIQAIADIFVRENYELKEVKEKTSITRDSRGKPINSQMEVISFKFERADFWVEIHTYPRIERARRGVIRKIGCSREDGLSFLPPEIQNRYIGEGDW